MSNKKGMSIEKDCLNFVPFCPNVLISALQIDILLQNFYKIIQEIFEKRCVFQRSRAFRI